MNRLCYSLLVLGFTVLVSACQASPSASGGAQPTIVTSPNDHREYRYIKLDNGIQVTLVSNPNAEMSAAAVGVNAGHHQNPKEWPGLAHLLEHMLFLGSQKYPQPDDFDDFISGHGGSSNAWTSETDTVYYLSISKEHLFPALDRLSQFFISPLMQPDLLDRERHAVDSEFQIYRQQDPWRITHVKKATVNPEHPTSLFSVGTLQTLSDHNNLILREALLEFYETWYSPENMSIAIVSDENLDDLEKKTRQLFEAIARKTAPGKPALPELFTENEKALRLDIQTKKQLRNLSLSFPLPVDAQFLQEKPTFYIAHLLGHEGQGSLYSFLKGKGWIQSLGVWGQDDTRDANFQIDISLTEQGYHHIDEITGQVFAYLQLIREKGISQDIFNELHNQQELRFQFLEKASPDETAVNLVESMPIHPPEQLIQGRIRVPQFNPEKIRSVLKTITPDNMRMHILNNTPPPVPKKNIRIEPWTGASYSLRKFTEEQKDGYLSARLDPALTLPPANPFMPDDLSLIKETETETPELMISKPGLQSWFRHDNSFEVPKNNVFIRFTTPDTSATPESIMQFHLYAVLLNNHFNDTLYLAGLAGSSYNLWLDHHGFTVEVSGFNEGLPAFFHQLLQQMQSFKVDPEKLQLEKDLVRDQLRNIALQDPLQHLNRAFNTMIYTREFSVQEKLAALEGITPEQLQKWFNTLFSQTSVTMLTNGNVSKTTARQLTDVVQPLVSSQKKKSYGSIPHSIPDTPKQPICYVSYDNDDYSIAVLTQSQTRDMATRVTAQILDNLLSSPFYNRLRTEEQLGYIVFTDNTEFHRFPTLTFMIQSPEFSPEKLDQRINNFLEDFRETITDLTDEELQRHKDGVISALQETESSLSEQSQSFWSEIESGFTDFDQVEQLLDAVKKVSAEDIKNIYGKLLERKHQIRLYGYGKKQLPESLPPACNAPEFTEQFKERSH